MKKYFLILLFFGISQVHLAQYKKLSAHSEVSIITVGPGDQLFETFGHSAIRVKDTVLNFDLVYNYGVFDFDNPNFYLNFVKGDLLYRVDSYPFYYFLKSSKKEKRWVKEQILNLSLEEKQVFFNYLENNVKPKNATYYYDPYFNNCATKLRDISKKVLGKKILFKNTHLTEKFSLRELMEKEIHWNTWGSFGINIALGSILDREAKPEEYMYLPDYVFFAYKNAEILKENKLEKLVKKENTLLDFKEREQQIATINPFLVFSLITIFGLLITFRDFKNKKRSKWLDFLIFFFTGTIGTIIVFLWFFTNHYTAADNFNFLWALAPNLFISFFLLREQPQKWIKKYIIVLLFFLLLVPIIWVIKIQLFPKAISPFLILLFVRYLFLNSFYSKAS